MSTRRANRELARVTITHDPVEFADKQLKAYRELLESYSEASAIHGAMGLVALAVRAWDHLEDAPGVMTEGLEFLQVIAYRPIAEDAKSAQYLDAGKARALAALDAIVPLLPSKTLENPRIAELKADISARMRALN